jgi:hypothetical protein
MFGKSADDKGVQKELEGMKASVEAMVAFKWSDLTTNGPEMNRYRAAVALATQTFQQLAGAQLAVGGYWMLTCGQARTW